MNVRRLEDIVGEALEMATAERAAFIRGACAGDERLEAEAMSLVGAHEEAEGFLADPTMANLVGGLVTGPASPLGEGPGTRIGRYKLLEQIGEGGFGVVFMAEQSEPIVRRVALKIIKLGMDTKQVIARFEAERQALAMMDHANIAKVLDAGATETGRPYFVMELVRGEPVTVFCDRHRLTVRERLEVFREICAAVQHAHQKGVIHRDIKPSNVLVTVADGRPAPKVIDFGIAKAMHFRLTASTLFTEFRQLIGTPEYMSPEQSEVSGIDVDTRSDVYSLGVLLHELLTGVTPLDSARLRSAALAEMQRMIQEEPTPRPSTRLATAAGLESIAERRRIEPGRLAPTIRGDLDMIIMKCLEKDRGRRFDSASSLSEDLRRHLASEPISARPPGAWYTVRKFVRRHRRWTAAALAVGSAVALGVAGTAGGLVWALRERDAAREAQRSAEIEAAWSHRVGVYLANPLQTVLPDVYRSFYEEWERRLEQDARTLPADDLRLVSREALYVVHRWSDLWVRAGADRVDSLKPFSPRLERLYRAARGRLAVSDPLWVAIANSETQRRIVIDRAGPAELAPQYEELVRAMEAAYGKTHYITQHMLIEYATVLQAAQQPERAIEAAREYVVRRGAAAPGENDPNLYGREAPAYQVFSAAGAPADLLVSLSRLCYEDAKALFAPTADEYYAAARTYGKDLWDQERFGEAESVYAEMLGRLRERPASDPVAMLVTVFRLGAIKVRLGKFAEAEPVLREAVSRSAERDGTDHFYAQRNRGWLGEALVGLERYEEAEAVLLESRRGLVKHAESQPGTGLGTAGTAWRPPAGVSEGEFAFERKRSVQRLVRLYEAWGRPEEQARWSEIERGVSY